MSSCRHKPSKGNMLSFSRDRWISSNIGVQHCRKCGEFIRPRKTGLLKIINYIVFILVIVVDLFAELYIKSYYPPLPFHVLQRITLILALLFYLFGGELFSWEPAVPPADALDKKAD